MKIQFGIRIDERVIEQLKRKAQADNRTTSNLIIRILTQYVREDKNGRKRKA